MNPLPEDKPIAPGDPNSPSQSPQAQPEQQPQPEQVPSALPPFAPAPDTTNENLPAPLAPVQPKKSGFGRKKFIVIIVAAVVLLLAGAYATYALWYNNPQNAVADALSKITTMKNGTAKGFIEASGEDSMKLRASFDYAQSSPREGSLTGDIKITSGDQNYTLKASLVADKENKAYIKLENVKKVIDAVLMQLGMQSESLTMFDGLIAKVDNKWLVLTPKDLAGGDEKAEQETECTTKAVEKFSNDKTQQKEVFDAYSKNQFVIAKFVNTESVNNIASNHYELTFDKQKAQSFVKAIKQTTFFKAVDTCSQQDLANVYDEAMVNEFLSGAAKAKVEFWVAQWGHNPTKARVSVEESGNTFTAETTINLGTKPTVTIPKPDTTFDDLKSELESIQQQFLGDLYSAEGPEVEQPVLGARTPQSLSDLLMRF